MRPFAPTARTEALQNSCLGRWQREQDFGSVLGRGFLLAGTEASVIGRGRPTRVCACTEWGGGLGLGKLGSECQVLGVSAVLVPTGSPALVLPGQGREMVLAS